MGHFGAAGWLNGVYWYTQKRSAHHLGSEVEVQSSIVSDNFLKENKRVTRRNDDYEQKSLN